MPITSTLEKERKYCQRVLKDEKKLREEYNSSSYKIGTYDELISNGSIGLKAHQEFLKKAIKLNLRADTAIESGWMTEDAVVKQTVEPEQLIEQKAPEFSQHLYDELAEVYCGRSGQYFKYKNESKGRFLERVISDNQKVISKVASVRSTILRIYNDIDISDYSPSQTELTAFNEKQSDVNKDIEHLKRELVHLKRETDRAQTQFEKYQYAIIEKTIDDVQTSKKKEEKKERKLTMIQIDRKIEKLGKEMTAHLATKDKLTEPDDLIQYGVGLQILKSSIKKYNSEKKYFGRNILQEQVDERKEERRKHKEQLIENSTEWNDPELIEDANAEFIEKKYEVKKIDTIENPEKISKQPKLSSPTVRMIKPMIFDYLETQGLEALFNDLQGVDMKERKEKFQTITHSLSKSKNPEFDLATKYSIKSPNCIQSIIHTLYNEWLHRERQ